MPVENPPFIEFQTIADLVAAPGSDKVEGWVRNYVQNLATDQGIEHLLTIDENQSPDKEKIPEHSRIFLQRALGILAPEPLEKKDHNQMNPVQNNSVILVQGEESLLQGGWIHRTKSTQEEVAANKVLKQRQKEEEVERIKKTAKYWGGDK
ncbi:MAG TPA: hypothetical protein VLF89_02810 [Candidatus Saccharimonadales bacterium]|nr:hypothetical protein [Candidatus Saccharimonadales bacterium]